MIVLYSEDRIKKKVEEVSNLLRTHLYNTLREPISNRNLVFLGVLNGAIHFTSDLFREFGAGQLDFISCKSYIENVQQLNGEIRILPQYNLKGKDIVLVEDIIDTGKTIVILEKYLESLEVNSITVVSCLVKKKIVEEQPFSSHCIAMFVIDEDEWVYGYGMDDNEDKRYLKKYLQKIDICY